MAFQPGHPRQAREAKTLVSSHQPFGDNAEEGSRMYAVVNPATGETVKEYPTTSDEELRSAIARADDAHGSWGGSSTVAERAALVRKVGELHVERRQELAEIIVREMGKPIEQ